MTKPLLILFLILAFLQPNSKACIHDTLNHKVHSKNLIRPDPSSNRILVSGTDSIRISPYYFLDNVNDRIKKAISEQIMPAVISYYQATLKVQRLNGKIGLDNTDTQQCAGVNSLTELNNGVETDLILLVTATRDTSSNYIAAATACFNAAVTNWRPYTGHVKFNIVYGFSDDTEFNFQRQIYTTLHEMGHVFGFSAALYDYYVSPGTSTRLGYNNVILQQTVNGVPINILTVDPLKSKLQTHFNCLDLEGAYIEQQGGTGSAGSHFERRIFMNELMTASSTTDSRITEFFLALLEGTGWYYPDYTKAEPVFWGKNQGCNFLRTKCLDSNLQTAFSTHYCTQLNVDSCTFSNEAYGVCGSTVKMKSSSLLSAFNYWGDNTAVTDIFADNCPYYYAFSQTECKDASNSAINLPGGEYFGAESNCFTGTLNSGKTIPFCLKKTCQGSAGSYTILVTVGSTSVTCSSAGPISVTGYTGTLTCPDPNTFCAASGAVYCPRGCMGKGTCNNGVCTCNSGYSGDDCSYDGVMSFSEIKNLYPYVPPVTSKTSNTKVIIGAAVGAGAGVILVIAAYFVIKIKRNRLRKAAAQREAAKRNEVAAQNNPDSRGINVDVVEQNQWSPPSQQLYTNENNPQMQTGDNNNNNLDQNNNQQNQNAPQQVHIQQQELESHIVQIPNNS